MAKLAALNQKQILSHKKPLIQKLSSIKIKVYMLYTTWYSFPHIPRPQLASLAWGLQATSDLDFIKYKKWPFLQEMCTSGTKKRKNYSLSLHKYFLFYSVYPEKLGDEISKIKISKLGVMTGDFDSVQTSTRAYTITSHLCNSVHIIETHLEKIM